MMIALYIIIGIAVGAVVLYLLRMDALRIAGGKADIELKMKTEQLAEKTSRLQHLEAENRTLHAKAESQGRELQLLHQQMTEELQRNEARFKNMAQQLLEQSASKLKESNTETMSGITQPLKDAIANMRADADDDAADTTTGREGREPYQRVAPRQQSQWKHGRDYSGRSAHITGTHRGNPL